MSDLALTLPEQKISSDNGYALPSVLFIITLLSFIAVSVISLQYLQRARAMADIASIKAGHAAESGVARALADLHFSSDLFNSFGRTPSEFPLQDGARARVGMRPWGLFLLLDSEGSFQRSKTRRVALVAEHPPEPFRNALVFGNANHQLVLTGTAHVTGNVITGRSGATVGNLPNCSTPARLPISGTIQQEQSPEIPKLRTDLMDAELRELRQLLEAPAIKQNVLVLSSKERTVIDDHTIPDSTLAVLIRGRAIISGQLLRRATPLRLAVLGDLELLPEARLVGLISLMSRNQIRIPSGTVIEHAIIASLDSIELLPGSSAIAQLVSPVIKVDSGSTLRYPSALLSLPIGDPNVSQQLTLRNGARVHGLVALSSPSGRNSQTQNLLCIQPGAELIGAAFSTHLTTLDGTVVGTVLTRDFYFYEAPTHYRGWVRCGTVDRSGLPKGFLLPVGFSNTMQLDILDWL